ncbi:hypothetical protein [Inconstantimicrobium mannanitabidum]|uniref:Hydrolase n=1 Tax=Inconstantimicrobium mannanitabidum TaxID=1604901 RepID=A0ACB5RDU9_9CLOT|nr:hypothetical protein [Clostridium sp. TW13]GKX66962.1 hydrolase [Clostridium sp. TW13]
MNRKIKLGCIPVIVLLSINFVGCTNKNLTVSTSGEVKQVEKTSSSDEKQKSEDLLKQAEKLSQGYFYDEAISLLEKDKSIKSSDIESAIDKYKKEKSSLVKYNGPIFHVFFHSLIVYPELAFDKDSKAEGYDMWMTTVNEFKVMLPKFKEDGYVLYDIEQTVEKTDDGKIKPKDIYLPKGKKPLIISVDDVSYYKYMDGDGFAQKLALNSSGDVINLVRNKDGQVTETYDGDVMPILNKYVEANPDFSYRGAKGVIALTGYEGILGYRITDLKGEELKTATEQCSKVVSKLKETGWKFASHSYTHNNYFKDGTITLGQLRYDTERWKKYIEPVVGKTQIYVSPFGVLFNENGPLYRYLVGQGFDIYCSVGSNLKTEYNKDNMQQSRFDLDGYTMLKNADYVKKYYFDPKDVLEASRPPIK